MEIVLRKPRAMRREAESWRRGRHGQIYESGGWMSAEDDDEIEKSETIGIVFIARRSDKACGDGATGGKASHDDNGSAELHR